MMNPIRNIERKLGAGGPRIPGMRRMSFSPLRHEHHNYPKGRMRAGLGTLRFQEGGAPSVDDLRVPEENLSPHDAQLQDIVREAMLALRGEHPNPQAAVKKFVETFGEDEFRELRNMVLGQGPGEEEGEEEPEGPGEQEPPPAAASGMQVGGLLSGPGSGQSDEIEATTPNGRRVLLSDGEYVIDAPTVAALGDGSTSAGARRLDALRKEIRRLSYGHDKQAKPMAKGGRALLAALGR